jgi:hypothetical protein
VIGTEVDARCVAGQGTHVRSKITIRGGEEEEGDATDAARKSPSPLQVRPPVNTTPSGHLKKGGNN